MLIPLRNSSMLVSPLRPSPSAPFTKLLIYSLVFSKGHHVYCGIECTRGIIANYQTQKSFCKPNSYPIHYHFTIPTNQSHSDKGLVPLVFISMAVIGRSTLYHALVAADPLGVHSSYWHSVSPHCMLYGMYSNQ